MSPHLDALLCSRYPVLLRNRHLPKSTSLMAHGFACDDGWFDLIEELCAGLQTAVDAGRISQPVAVQVKQKFGGLRFYISNDSEEARQLIATAERRALATCEICGKPGILRRQNGVKTVCDAHALPGATPVVAELPEGD